MKEKIGIIGSGVVGQNLGKGFLKSGYEVKVGSRNPDKLKEWLDNIDDSNASAGSFEETASFADVIVIAVHGVDAINAIDLAGKENFSGKIVIDVTNPLEERKGTYPKLASTQENPLGKKIQDYIPDAKVVKAFNIVSSFIMINPVYEDNSPDMFIAGNDEEAKQWVNNLVLYWGWNSCNDLGGIEESYWLEAFAMLWVVYGFKNNHWTHAFKLLHR